MQSRQGKKMATAAVAGMGERSGRNWYTRRDPCAGV